MMKFNTPLITGTLIKRYKRFLTDVQLDSGEIVTAHCTNTGTMMGLIVPGARVWLSKSNNPNRKLAYTWEMVESDGVLVGVNTGHPNLLVSEAIKNGILREFTGYSTIRREVKYGQNSRIDVYLSDPGKPPCYIEVKTVHLKRGKYVEFPDAVTERGKKHLLEMIELVKNGCRAAMVYVVQREDGELFSLAKDIDPMYAQTAAIAFESGVEVYIYPCKLSEQEIILQPNLLKYDQQ